MAKMKIKTLEQQLRDSRFTYPPTGQALWRIILIDFLKRQYIVQCGQKIMTVNQYILDNKFTRVNITEV